jgi:carboxyl-terminal processing protease
MKLKFDPRLVKNFVLFSLLCALWFAVGWVARGYRLGPELALIDQVRQRLLNEFAGDELDPRELSYAAIRGILRKSGDPQAALLEPAISSRFWDDFSGEAGLVGVQVGQEDGRLVIAAITPGDPADLAGLQQGDIILAVDRILFDENTTETEAAMLIRGPVGTAAHFVVQRGGEVLWFQPVRREGIIAEGKMLDARIAYLAQYNFSKNAVQVVKGELDGLLAQNPEGLIWDLRYNTGGSMDSAQEIASLFIEEGVLFQAELKGDRRQQFEAQGDGEITPVPLVVLIGPQTYSSAEAVAIAIRERGRGVLLGGTTYGKGTIQATVPLLDGSMLKFTVARWLSPHGEWFEGRGVDPDFPIQDDPHTQKDEVLEFAVDLLRRVSSP